MGTRGSRRSAVPDSDTWYCYKYMIESITKVGVRALRPTIIYAIINLIIQKESIVSEAIITMNPTIRSGKPCIRNLRITVYDILNMLASGMSYEEILEDYPKLTQQDILASLQYAADREHKTTLVKISA